MLPSFQKIVPNSRATPMEKLNRVALYCSIQDSICHSVPSRSKRNALKGRERARVTSGVRQYVIQNLSKQILACDNSKASEQAETPAWQQVHTPVLLSALRCGVMVKATFEHGQCSSKLLQASQVGSSQHTCCMKVRGKMVSKCRGLLPSAGVLAWSMTLSVALTVRLHFRQT